MRQQLPNPTLQAGEDVLQIREWLVPIQARRLDQAHDRKPPANPSSSDFLAR